MHRIFITHGQADREFADQLATELKSQGCRILSEDLIPGNSIQQIRTSTVSRADVVIAILSESSSGSPYIIAEIGAATAFDNKLLIPILLDEAMPPSVLAERIFIRASSADPYKALPEVLRALSTRSTMFSRDRALLVTSILGAVASVVGTFLSAAIASDFASDALPFLSAIHWTIWVCSVPAIFTIACYVNDRLPEDRRRLPWVLSVPVWTQLRGFGDQRVARISYIALAAIPILSYFVSENPLNIAIFETLTLPLGFRLTFFASWFFSIALILFVSGCPKPFRQSHALEHARTVNLMLQESPSAQVIIDSPSDVEDPALDSTLLELRAVCFTFYILGISVAGIILFRAAWFVTRA